MRTLQLTLGPAYDDVAQHIEARLRPVDTMEVVLVAQIVRATWRLDHCEQTNNPQHPEIDRVRHHAESSIRRNMAELRQLQADRHLNEKLNLDVPGVARVKDVLQSTALSRRLVTESATPQPQVAEVETKIAAIVTKEEELHAANLKIRTHSAAAKPVLTPGHSTAGSNSGQRTHSAAAKPVLSPGHSTAGGNSGQRPPIGRNTPCPCGSKLKHKRCCGSGAPPQYYLSPLRDRAAQSLLVNEPPIYSVP